MTTTARTASTQAAVSADVAAKAQKELAKLVKSARVEYSQAATASKVTRDTAIAEAYALFAKDPSGEAQKALTASVKTARKGYSAAVTAAKVARDSKIAQAYHAFSEATGQTA